MPLNERKLTFWRICLADLMFTFITNLAIGKQFAGGKYSGFLCNPNGAAPQDLFLITKH